MISKSNYVNGLRCQKLLWLNIHKRKLQKEASAQDQARFDTGNEVGRLATQLFPGGIEIELDLRDISAMVEKTKELIADGVETIYEATFDAHDARAMVDILHKTPEGWDIYEVKSSTSVKPTYYDDASIQWFILNTIPEIKLNKIYIVHLNNQYERDGELDINEIFTKVDLTETVKEKQEEVAVNLEVFINIENGDEPLVEIGTQCNKLNECSFKETYCWQHIPKPSIFDVSSISAKKKFELYKENIIEITDVPNAMELSEKQNKIVSSYINKEVFIDKEAIQDFLDTIEYPISFFDFETFSDAIPRFNKQKPYQAIPSQYSLHIVETSGEMTHKEFLGDENSDPREELVKRMLSDLPTAGSIVAANSSYEKGIIKELAKRFPSLGTELMALTERLIDIQVPFKKYHYCHPDFLGRYSMKVVVPALFPGEPELDYTQFDIQGGGDAMNAFANLHNVTDKDERDKIRESLLGYCKIDTLGMVKIFEWLRVVMGNDG